MNLLISSRKEHKIGSGLDDTQPNCEEASDGQAGRQAVRRVEEKL